MTPEEKLQEMGIELPEITPGHPAMAPGVISGNLLYLSGSTPPARDGTPWERARRRRAKLRARLAGTRTFPEKPRGMRWSTYERLRQELDVAEGHAFGGSAARHEALIARFEQELEHPR